MNTSTTRPAVSKRTNFVGYTVTFEEYEEFTLTVVPAVAQPCDMCDPGTPEQPNNCAAEYTVDAVSVLGEGGSNSHYCQEHMILVVDVLGPDAGDQWAAPVETEAWLEALGTAEVYARCSGSTASTFDDGKGNVATWTRPRHL